MKYEKLKAETIVPQGCALTLQMYPKSEVDAAIAELKQKLEDAGMRERRMRRALYKALANWAHFAVAFFSSFKTKDKWHKMEHKCLKKAEEYE